MPAEPGKVLTWVLTHPSDPLFLEAFLGLGLGMQANMMWFLFPRLAVQWGGSAGIAKLPLPTWLSLLKAQFKWHLIQEAVLNLPLSEQTVSL